MKRSPIAKRRTTKRRTAPKPEPCRDMNTIRQVVWQIRQATLTVAQGARELAWRVGELHNLVWNLVKASVLRRDRDQCVMCGQTARFDILDVNHRTPRGAGGTADPEIAYGQCNLVTACRTCHTFYETRERELGYAVGFFVHRNTDPGSVPVKHWRLGWAVLVPLPAGGGSNWEYADTAAVPGLDARVAAVRAKRARPDAPKEDTR